MCLESAPMDYKKLAGERIREAREAKGMSRPQLAALIKGLGASTLSNYELGLRYPPPQTLIDLGKVLGEPPSYLAGIEPDKQAEALRRIYSKLDGRGKETVFRVAESQSAAVAGDSEQNVSNGYTNG